MFSSGPRGGQDGCGVGDGFFLDVPLAAHRHRGAVGAVAGDSACCSRLHSSCGPQDLGGGANKGVFLLAPLVTCVLALAAWAVIPVNANWVIADINVGVLYIFAISSLMVYGVIMAGWASNSKYPFLAALRSAAQMVSYEVSSGFVIITVLLCAGSLNLSAIVAAQDGKYGLFSWYWLPLFPVFVVFFISALAETNRPPFDLVEAESELVAGFMVEYGSTPYMMFMLGEYVAIGTMCAMATILFLGG